MPLLRIEPVADAELGTGPWAAVIFTSANAVRAVAVHRRFSELADLPVYTVGRRTQAAAAAAGFTSIMSADGDVNALIQLIASKPPLTNLPLTGAGMRGDGATSLSPPPCGVGSGAGVGPRGTSAPRRPAPPPHPSPTRGEGNRVARPQLNRELPLLYCAGEDRAGDLAGTLQLYSLGVETAVVYRATMVTELTPDAGAGLASGAIDAVLHYSARTAAAFVAAATRAGIRDLSIQTRHLCLSAQVAAPLAAAGARTIEVASEANEQALLALIGRT
jgi:uroporphyrinogen-III synthase